MKVQFGLVLLGLLSGVSPALAQTAVAALPQGQAISGWAVEVIPNDDQRPVEQFMGLRGLARVGVPSGWVSFRELAQQAGAGTTKTAHNGRAFLKVSSEGANSFAIQLRPSGTPESNRCETILYLGGKKILAGKIEPTRSLVTVSGNADLSPGYYAVEYIVRCSGWYDSFSEYNILYRGPTDNSLRPFDDSELIHVQR